MKLEATGLAELRHGDPAQRQGRWIVAQRDSVQGAEPVAGDKRARRGGKQGIHEGRLLDDDEGVDGVACGPAL